MELNISDETPTTAAISTIPPLHLSYHGSPSRPRHGRHFITSKTSLGPSHTQLLMALNAEPAHPDEREALDLPPKSYAEAAEEGLSKVNGVSGTKAQDDEESMTPGALNPEPALPEEREALDLPPKSYAEAAEEGLPTTNGVNGTTEQGDEESSTAGALNPEPALPEEREAQNLPPKSYAEAAEEGLPKTNGINGAEEQDDKHSITPGPLNPEPALPEEREAQNLPPKSYAEAVEEGSPKVDGVDGTNDENQRSQSATPLNTEPARPEEREAQNLLPKSYAEAADPTVNGVNHSKTRVAQNVTNILTNGKIRIPSRESPEEYEGAGQDGSPKTPVKHSHGHRRRSSQHSTGSPKHKSSQSVDHIYEKHVDEKGHSLTTVKAGKDLQRDHRVDKTPIKHQKEALVAGRQAGAGWEKSRYVCHLAI